MGDNERRDRLSVFNGKKVRVSTFLSLKSIILYPYYAWKNYQRRREIRKSLFGNQGD